MEIVGESGREMRISRKVDFVLFGAEDRRISDRLGEPPEAIVIKGDWAELTLINARDKEGECQLIDDFSQLSLIVSSIIADSPRFVGFPVRYCC